MWDFHRCSSLAVLLFLLIWGAGSPGHADVFLPQLPESEQQPVQSLEVVGDALWVLGKRDLYRVGRGGAPEIIKAAAGPTAVVSFEGKIYFGTKTGLYRFGDEDTPEREQPSVTSLAVFEETLWIGAERGLFILDNWDPIHRLEVTDLKVIKEDLWIASYQGAHRIPGSTTSNSSPALARALEPILFEDGTPPPPIKNIEWIGDEIWLITLDRDRRFGWAGRPYRMRDDKAVALENTDGWQASSVWATPDGAVFATRDGFGTLDENGAGNLTLLEEPARLIFEWDNFTWIGTTKGLYRAKEISGRPERSPVGGLLKAHGFEVFDGALWLATEQGLFKLESGLQLSGRVGGLPVKLNPGLDLVVEYVGASDQKNRPALSFATMRAESDGGNNKTATIDDNGRTAFRLRLSPGSHSDTFIVTDKFGNSSDLEYKVLILPKLWTWTFIIGFALTALMLMFLLRKKFEIADNDQ